MRKGEVLGTSLKSLNIEQGYLKVTQALHFIARQGLVLLKPKTEKSKRMIKLSPFIVEA